MGKAIGKCDICGKEITAKTLDDNTEYLHWGDEVISGCNHYSEGTILSDLEKLRIDLIEVNIPAK